MAKPELILLAIDESPVIPLLDRALRAVSYSTAIVHNRLTLDKALRETSPALVIMSEYFEGESGTQLIEGLLERFPTLPVLLFAERNDLAVVKEALRIGVSDCIYPPLQSEEIVKSVRNSLRRAQTLGDWLRREVKRTTASLEQRVDELETLVKLGRVITGTLDLDTVLTNVVAAAVELTGAEEGSLLMLDEASGELYMRADHNFQEGFARSFRLPVQDTLAGQVIQNGKPVILNETALYKIKTAYLVRALIYVPLRLQERVIGVLGVDNRQARRPFSDRHALQMSVLADYAAIAIENARLYKVSETERIKFQATFTNIGDGVIILDEERRVLLINPAMRMVFGLNAAVLDGQDILAAIPHPDLRALLTRSAENVLEYHEVSFEDGRVYNALCTPIPGVGAAITMQDITYLKELDRLKNDFVHTVSHDLRSPLTAVLGYTELLERVGRLNDQQLEFVRRIQASVQNITTLVNDLLDLGRIEAGFDMRREVVQLDGILQYTLDCLQVQIGERNLHLHVNTAPALPPLRGNPIRLRQMLDNLIGNAIKYTPPGGEVSIAMRTEGDQIIVQVADSGPGIPPADQPRIFDKFYRGSNAPPDVPGSGLGLAIVKSIVDNHQGRIWVESALNKGTTFIIVLPAYDSSHVSAQGAPYGTQSEP